MMLWSEQGSTLSFHLILADQQLTWVPRASLDGQNSLLKRLSFQRLQAFSAVQTGSLVLKSESFALKLMQQFPSQLSTCTRNLCSDKILAHLLH